MQLALFDDTLYPLLHFIRFLFFFFSRSFCCCTFLYLYRKWRCLLFFFFRHKFKKWLKEDDDGKSTRYLLLSHVNVRLCLTTPRGKLYYCCYFKEGVAGDLFCAQTHALRFIVFGEARSMVFPLREASIAALNQVFFWSLKMTQRTREAAFSVFFSCSVSALLIFFPLFSLSTFKLCAAT